MTSDGVAPAGKQCSGCAQVKPVGEFYTQGSGGKPFSRCKECVRLENGRRHAEKRAARWADPEAARAKDAALKAETFAAYGGRCACCGETVAVFLRIEPLERRDGGARGTVGVGLWRKLRGEGWPATHALYCANCSLGRLLGCGICPHVIGPQIGTHDTQTENDPT